MYLNAKTISKISETYGNMLIDLPEDSGFYDSVFKSISNQLRKSCEIDLVKRPKDELVFLDGVLEKMISYEFIIRNRKNQDVSYEQKSLSIILVLRFDVKTDKMTYFNIYDDIDNEDLPGICFGVKSINKERVENIIIDLITQEKTFDYIRNAFYNQYHKIKTIYKHG